VCWGQLAQQFGIAPALVVASIGAVVAIGATWRFRLSGSGELDLSPSSHWPQPLVSSEIEHDRGPVMVTTEYRIDPARASEFLSAMQELARARRRDGAYAWGIYQDTAAPNRFLEYFIEDSWLEHLRHHDRVTQFDRAIQTRIESCLVDGSPLVTHYLAPNASTQGPH
jgi:quinol monooxygenase YgiN